MLFLFWVCLFWGEQGDGGGGVCVEFQKGSDGGVVCERGRGGRKCLEFSILTT